MIHPWNQHIRKYILHPKDLSSKIHEQFHEKIFLQISLKDTCPQYFHEFRIPVENHVLHHDGNNPQSNLQCQSRVLKRIKKCQKYHTKVHLFKTVTRQSPGSHQAIIRQSPGSYQVVIAVVKLMIEYRCKSISSLFLLDVFQA